MKYLVATTLFSAAIGSPVPGPPEHNPVHDPTPGTVNHFTKKVGDNGEVWSGPTFDNSRRDEAGYEFELNGDCPTCEVDLSPLGNPTQKIRWNSKSRFHAEFDCAMTANGECDCKCGQQGVQGGRGDYLNPAASATTTTEPISDLVAGAAGGGGCPDGFTADPDNSSFCVAEGLCRMKDSFIPQTMIASCNHGWGGRHCATVDECRAVCVDAGADCIGVTFKDGKCWLAQPWKKDQSGDPIQNTPTCRDCSSDNAAIEAKRILWNPFWVQTDYGSPFGSSAGSFNPSQQYFGGTNTVDMTYGTDWNGICYAKIA